MKWAYAISIYVMLMGPVAYGQDTYADHLRAVEAIAKGGIIPPQLPVDPSPIATAQPHRCTCGCETTGQCKCPNCSVGCGFIMAEPPCCQDGWSGPDVGGYYYYTAGGVEIGTWHPTWTKPRGYMPSNWARDLDIPPPVVNRPQARYTQYTAPAQCRT